jgi:hypothetical protein
MPTMYISNPTPRMITSTVLVFSQPITSLVGSGNVVAMTLSPGFASQHVSAVHNESHASPMLCGPEKKNKNSEARRIRMKNSTRSYDWQVIVAVHHPHVGEGAHAEQEMKVGQLTACASTSVVVSIKNSICKVNFRIIAFERAATLIRFGVWTTVFGWFASGEVPFTNFVFNNAATHRR